MIDYFSFIAYTVKILWLHYMYSWLFLLFWWLKLFDLLEDKCFKFLENFWEKLLRVYQKS